MQSSLALSVGLPVVLCIIMLGLGLSVTLEDFKRTLSRPKPVVVGLICQFAILPVLCLALVYVSGLPPAISVGMMLLAASPGGTSAAIYTHLAHGDVALSITLAAVTSVAAMLSLPAIATVSMALFYDGAVMPVGVQFSQVLQIFIIAVVPAMIGCFIRSYYPATALRLDRPVKILATVFLALVVLFALISQWGLLAVWGPTVGIAVLLFNLTSLTVGYFVPLMFDIERRQAIALAMSIGIHNGALVITMALSEYMLNNSEMGIPSAAYGLVAYITGGIFVWMVNRRQIVSDGEVL